MDTLRGPRVRREQLALIARKQGLQQRVLKRALDRDRIEGLEEAGHDAVLIEFLLAKLVTNQLSTAILGGTIKEGGAARIELRDAERIEVIAA